MGVEPQAREAETPFGEQRHGRVARVCTRNCGGGDRRAVGAADNSISRPADNSISGGALTADAGSQGRSGRPNWGPGSALGSRRGSGTGPASEVGAALGAITLRLS